MAPATGWYGCGRDLGEVLGWDQQQQEGAIKKARRNSEDSRAVKRFIVPVISGLEPWKLRSLLLLIAGHLHASVEFGTPGLDARLLI